MLIAVTEVCPPSFISFQHLLQTEDAIVQVKMGSSFQLHVPVPSRFFVFIEAAAPVGEQQHFLQDWLTGLRVSPCAIMNRKEAIEENERGKSIFSL